MAVSRYVIMPNGNRWAMRDDSSIAGEYLTREAAFEAVVASAATAIKQGNRVEVIVEEEAIQQRPPPASTR